jgi:hypothetical protein
MTGVVAISQPRYYPRLHYLARVQEADVFVIYDDVQFSRRSPQHRAPIDYRDRTWLTIPIRHAGEHPSIDETRIDMSEPWPSRHVQTLHWKYGDAAMELQSFYERLCPPVFDPESIRERTGEGRTIDGVDDERLDDWLALDERWRERHDEYRTLRARKAEIGEEISQRKRDDPDAPIDELVADADDVAAHLSDVESTTHELAARRDNELVSLSAEVDAETPLEALSLKERWNLDGIDFATLAEPVRLVDLTVPLLEALFQRFEVDSEIVRSSELPVDRTDDASEYLARLTDHVGGDSYLSGGVGYENYLDEDPFDEHGLDVLVQEWTPAWEAGNVCALDVLYDSTDPAEHIR